MNLFDFIDKNPYLSIGLIAIVFLFIESIIEIWRK